MKSKDLPLTFGMGKRRQVDPSTTLAKARVAAQDDVIGRFAVLYSYLRVTG